MYNIIRTILFAFDAERVHYFSMNVVRLVCRVPFLKGLLGRMFRPAGKGLSRNFLGLEFSNPVGLGAGFDKNALYLGELEAMGFGFVEIGTVTPVAQAGNEKPRLFRLPSDKALINRMGFNNDGVKIIAARLKSWKERKTAPQGLSPRLIIGGNIGKNKSTANEDAWKDYVRCFEALQGLVDYFVVNVSSPNTPGLRALQEKDSLRNILSILQTRNQSFPVQSPILLKIAPDLTKDQIDDVVELALEIKLDGLVVANTTISREALKTNKADLDRIGAGGLSGAPLGTRNTLLVEYIHQKTRGRLPLIASGGILSGRDASQKFAAGASLIQVWSGFIYKGPGIVKNICRYLSHSELPPDPGTPLPKDQFTLI